MTWCMSWSGDCNAVLMKTCHRKHHLLVFQTSSWMAWEYVVVWWLWCCFNENLRSAAIRNIISWPFKPLHGWPDTYQTTLLIHCGGIHSHKGVGVWWFWCCLNKSIGTPTAKNIISLSVKLLYGCVCVCVCVRMHVCARARLCVCACILMADVKEWWLWCCVWVKTLNWCSQKLISWSVRLVCEWPGTGLFIMQKMHLLLGVWSHDMSLSSCRMPCPVFRHVAFCNASIPTLWCWARRGRPLSTTLCR